MDTRRACASNVLGMESALLKICLHGLLLLLRQIFKDAWPLSGDANREDQAQRPRNT